MLFVAARGVVETGGICRITKQARQASPRGGGYAGFYIDKIGTTGGETPPLRSQCPYMQVMKRLHKQITEVFFAFYIDKDGCSGRETPPLQCNTRICRQ